MVAKAKLTICESLENLKFFNRALEYCVQSLAIMKEIFNKDHHMITNISKKIKIINELQADEAHDEL